MKENALTGGDPLKRIYSASGEVSRPAHRIKKNGTRRRAIDKNQGAGHSTLLQRADEKIGGLTRKGRTERTARVTIQAGLSVN